MRKIIIPLASISFCLLFCLTSCENSSKQKQTSNTNSESFDQITNWVVLHKSEAVKTGNRYSWDFKAKHPVEYVVQIVLDELPFKSRETVVKMDTQKIQGVIQKSYTTSNKKVVSEYNKPVKIADVLDTHVLSIETDSNFDQIRLVPYYKNPVGSGVYHKEWLKMHESSQKQAALAWFKEAKFGMFIHWGLYSQAGGVWKGTKINNAPYPGPKVAEWLMHAFRISRKEYATLAKTFNPDKTFAQNFARLAKDVGMKYVVITSKHHDGFALFDSESSTYDMVDATPYKADVVKELYEACLLEGIDFGVYYSHGNDWNDGGDGNYATIKKVNDSLGVYTHAFGKNLWDPSADIHSDYLNNKAKLQIKELLALLPKLRLIWFDGEGLINERQSFEFYKLVYDINPNVLVNRRVGWDFGDYLDAGDNKIPSSEEAIAKYWETCGTTNNSWGYKSYDNDWKSSKELLYYFVDIMSKGGNYLLNIGPDGKGHVPDQSESTLLEMGAWIQVNGEAIYGTSRWETVSEGQEETLLDGTGHRAAKGFDRSFSSSDFWFTAKDNHVYAISLMPSSKTIFIRSLGKNAGEIKAVSILGKDLVKSWLQTEKGLLINLKKEIKNKNGFAVKAEL